MVTIHTLMILLVQSVRVGSIGACCSIGIGCATLDAPPDRPQTRAGSPRQDAEHARDATLDEVLALYRRLHVEMDQDARSGLIVELLRDPREAVNALGFELISRELSTGASISPEAQDAAVDLLDAASASVRAEAVRLVTRLGLDDAHTLLARAIERERDPGVAAAILRGLERWPVIEARDEILAWYERPGPARRAAGGAAWALVRGGAFREHTESERIARIARSIPEGELGAADMRLLATLGTADDLKRLSTLVQRGPEQTRMEAAHAMASTPRGVEYLVGWAQEDATLFAPASEALIRHRANPDGLRRLVALPCDDPPIRRDAILRMGERLDRAELADAVRLARSESGLAPALAIELLTPLIASDRTPSPREAPGAVLLATLELDRGRPDRSLEVLSLIDPGSLDPATRLRAAALRVLALVLTGRYDEAAALGPDAAPWLDALDRIKDTQRRGAVALAILEREITLTPEQRAAIGTLLDASATDTTGADETRAPDPDAEDTATPDEDERDKSDDPDRP